MWFDCKIKEIATNREIARVTTRRCRLACRFVLRFVSTSATVARGHWKVECSASTRRPRSSSKNQQNGLNTKGLFLSCRLLNQRRAVDKSELVESCVAFLFGVAAPVAHDHWKVECPALVFKNLLNN